MWELRWTCGWTVVPPVKEAPKDASQGGLPGLPGLKGMSGPGKAPVSFVKEAVRRMWEWLKVGGWTFEGKMCGDFWVGPEIGWVRAWKGMAYTCNGTCTVI
jgi:hypothetical protein